MSTKLDIFTTHRTYIASMQRILSINYMKYIIIYIIQVKFCCCVNRALAWKIWSCLCSCFSPARTEQAADPQHKAHVDRRVQRYVWLGAVPASTQYMWLTRPALVTCRNVPWNKAWKNCFKCNYLIYFIGQTYHSYHTFIQIIQIFRYSRYFHKYSLLINRANRAGSSFNDKSYAT